MRLIQRLGNFVAKSLDGPVGNFSLPGLSFGGSGRSSSGQVIDQAGAMAISAFYACVRNIAEDLAKLTPVVYKWEKVEYGSGWVKKPVEGHTLMRLLNKPNKYQDRMQFLETLALSYAARGNAYSVIVRNQFGREEALIPIHPDRVTMLIAPNGQLFYQISSWGPQGFLSPADNPIATVPDYDMVHIKGLSYDGYKGMNPIVLMSNALSLSRTTEQQQESLFHHGARPGGVIEHPKRISGEAQDRLKNNWASMFAGPSNAGKTVLLEEGMKWHQLSMTAVDAEFMNTRKFQVEEIARFMRMPLHKIGYLDRSTNNNIAVQSLEYYKDCLSGPVKKFELGFARSFDLGSGYTLEFEVWELLRLDFAALMTTLQKGTAAGILTANEAREKLGLNPKDDPEADKLQQPLNQGNNPQNEDEANNNRTPRGPADPDKAT